jgi:N-acetylglucosamine kinase-like BadF-type ATPase
MEISPTLTPPPLIHQHITMTYYLGIDVGGTKTAALIATENGQAVGYAVAGAGNYEGVGWDGFKVSVQAAVAQVLAHAQLSLSDITAAGLGIAGYDWTSQKAPHIAALREIGLTLPLEIVNDAVLGILAGTQQGWGVSVVSGTGCNCRGWNQDHTREGRVVGGASEWSGEYAGGYDILAKAMQAVTFAWAQRGPKTALSDIFVSAAGAKDLDDLIEGLYVQRHSPFSRSLVLKVFEVAAEGDPEALRVMRWAGRELGEMASGVIRQIDIQAEAFDIVLIGSVYKGHPLIAQTLLETAHKIAPQARTVRLTAPPVVGAVLLGMEQAGVNGYAQRAKLIETTIALSEKTP